MLYGLLSEIIPKAIPKVICNAAYGTILKANAKAIHGDKHKVHCITIHRSRHKRSKHKPNCKFIDWNRERAVRSVSLYYRRKPFKAINGQGVKA